VNNASENILSTDHISRHHPENIPLRCYLHGDKEFYSGLLTPNLVGPPTTIRVRVYVTQGAGSTRNCFLFGVSF